MKKETKNEKLAVKMSILKKCILTFVLILFSINVDNVSSKTHTVDLLDNIEIVEDTLVNHLLPHDSIRDLMIEITDNYIKKSTRGKVNPKLAEYLVNNALVHNIDLCFMLGQTKIETHFGTAGIGKTKRSLFGVMKRRYSNYNKAIEDYCILLKSNYLIRGKTEQDLMRRYVNKSGRRYAGNPNYERELRNEYNKINKATNLRKLQNSYKEFLLSFENEKYTIDDNIET